MKQSFDNRYQVQQDFMNNNKIYEDLEYKQNQLRKNIKAKASKKQSDVDTRHATIGSPNEQACHKKASKSVAVPKGSFR